MAHTTLKPNNKSRNCLTALPCVCRKALITATLATSIVALFVRRAQIFQFFLFTGGVGLKKVPFKMSKQICKHRKPVA